MWDRAPQMWCLLVLSKYAPVQGFQGRKGREGVADGSNGYPTTFRGWRNQQSQILGSGACLLGMCASESLSFCPTSSNKSSLFICLIDLQEDPETEEERCPAVKVGQCWMARLMTRTQQPPPPPRRITSEWGHDDDG